MRVKVLVIEYDAMSFDRLTHRVVEFIGDAADMTIHLTSRLSDGASGAIPIANNSENY